MKKNTLKTVKSRILYSKIADIFSSQMAQNQPKSQILFHKDRSPRDLYNYLGPKRQPEPDHLDCFGPHGEPIQSWKMVP